ncbi:MAG: polyisoprenoid-binding protein [Proteobacteria bacterium]|nr:polyisoprenoid-binding protein [Pseudomonadota bacterium]
MKKLKLISLAILASVFIAQNASAEAVKYQIESNHAYVLWFANHFGFSNQSGKFSDVSGEINFDEKKPENSSVDVTIKIDSLVTGLPKFDKHLKSADFFDAEKFPTTKFVSKKIKVTGKNKAKIEGELTLHGVTKPVTLNAKFNKSDVSVVTQKPTIGFSATATIKRSEFGINYAVPAVSDNVELVIEVEANIAK